MNRSAFTVSRAYSDRMVSVRFKVQTHNFGTSIATQGSTDLSCQDARALAAALTEQAAAADLKAEKKVQADARRRAWRDREIAAGRMIVLGSGRL